MTRNRDGLAVRFVREWTNDFTGMTFREYADPVFGGTVSICVQAWFQRRPKTRAQCRAAAARKLNRQRHKFASRRNR